jgi:hypothetical protein
MDMRPAAGPNAVEHALRVVLLSAMAACLALPLAELAALLPGISSTFLVAACVLAVLEVGASFRLVRARGLMGTRLTQFRLAEAGVLVLAIAALNILVRGWPAGLGGPNAWLTDPGRALGLLFGGQVLLALLLAGLFALAANDSLADLERTNQLPEPGMPPQAAPTEALARRFFLGGMLLVALSGLAVVGPAAMLEAGRPPVTGVVANVLVYFVLGLLLLGRANLSLLRTRWRDRGVRVAPELPGRWARYSLGLIGLAALLAFALPTRYTAGAFGMLANVLAVAASVLLFLLMLVFTLAAMAVAWVMTQLLGTTPEVGIERQAPPPPLEFGPPPLPADLPAWVAAMRPVVVWGLAALMVGYVLYSYLRERPQIAAALRNLGLAQALKRLWAALRHRAGGLARAAREAGPLAWLRRRAGPAAHTPAHAARRRATGPRAKIRYYYLSTLQRAAARGVARRPSQTPRDYAPYLSAILPEAADEVQALTDSFIEARYSDHALAPQQAERARQAWLKLREQLRRPPQGR